MSESGSAKLEKFSSSTRLVIKLLIEFMPLGLFFLASTEFDFWVSTAVLMGATVVSLAWTWYLFRELALMALITAATSVVAGGFTLIWSDPHYVQMKPTIVGLVFASILSLGLLLKRPLFKTLLGHNLHLTDEGWRVLTWLWLAYFLFISGLNEYIWRNYSWEFWALFKAFGLMPLTVIYALPQIYLLKRYEPEAEALGTKAEEAIEKPRAREATRRPARAET
jgi:intracellular septation protein